MIQTRLASPRLAAILILLGTSAGSWGQFGEDDVTGFPRRGITRDASRCPNFPADLGIESSLTRLVLTSNCQVQIRSKDGPLTSQTFLQRDADLPDGLFTADIPERRVFDPRLFFDTLEDRFWIVASERVEGGEVFNNTAIHIAVSTSDTPTGWGADQWSLYRFDLRTENPVGDPIPQGFADRPSATVDEQFLYIAFEDVDQDTFLRGDDRTMVVIIPKVDMVAGGPKPTIDKMMFIDDDGQGAGLTTLHELSVDADLADDGLTLIYAIVTKDRPHFKQLVEQASPLYVNDQTSLILGALRCLDCDEVPPHTWTYERQETDLPGTNRDFKGSKAGGRGAPFAVADDSNYYPPSVFFLLVHRSSLGRLYAGHHVRPLPISGSDPERFVTQWYRVNPNGWPVTPGNLPIIQAARRVSPPDGPDNGTGADEWCGGVGIAVNSLGDVGIDFELLDNIKGNGQPDGMYPDLWSSVWLGGNTETQSPEKTNIDCYVTGDTWEDFVGMSCDPATDSYFYAHQLQAKSPCSPLPGVDDWESWVIRIDVPSPRPDPDMDGDGEVGLLDYLLFERAFVNGESAADLNEDGALDHFDFLLLCSAP